MRIANAMIWSGFALAVAGTATRLFSADSGDWHEVLRVSAEGLWVGIAFHWWRASERLARTAGTGREPDEVRHGNGVVTRIWWGR